MAASLSITAREMIVYKTALRLIDPELTLERANSDEFRDVYVLENSLALALVIRRRTVPSATIDDILNDSMEAIGAEIQAATPPNPTNRKPVTSKRGARSPSSTGGRSTKSVT